MSSASDDCAGQAERITEINRRDAMAWINALTEYFNAQTGGNLEPLYYQDSSHNTPIRSVDNTGTVDYPN